jgi:hypothetical protein
LFRGLVGSEMCIRDSHKGHKAAWELASKSPVWFVGTNESTVGPKDPLPFDVKVEAMKTVWPEVESHIVAETSWLTLASKVYEQYPDATLLCLTDEEWVTKTIVQYNGKEGAHGFYNFKNITQKPTPRLSSATALRDAVSKGDREAFTQAAGVSADTPVAGKPFFDLVAEYLLPYQNAPKKVAKKKVAAPVEGVQQTLRKVVPGYAKREIDKKMDAEKFGRRDVDKDANFQRYKKIQDKLKEQGVAENFADGKNPQDKGDSKRHGINTKASVSSLRKTAKQGGRKGQLAHWLANMKAGRAKKEDVVEGEVVAFPKKHKGDITDMHSCPKCGGDLQGGKYMGHQVQVCMPCKQVYLPPNSGIDQQGNKIKEGEAKYDSNYQDTVKRVGQMAKEGPRKTVWDPVKRVYKTVPVNPPKTETIKKVGSEYELVSKKGKNLGKYPSKAGAEKRERQVNYFKHMGEEAAGVGIITKQNSTPDVNKGTPRKNLKAFKLVK